MREDNKSQSSPPFVPPSLPAISPAGPAPRSRLRRFLLIGGLLLLILAVLGCILGYFFAPIAGRRVSEWGDGLFVGKKYPEALAMYHKAALLGNGHAQAMLGMAYNQKLYFYDSTSPDWATYPDWNRAAEWARKAAAKNDAEGLYVLGQMYHGGMGVPEDYNQAVSWYRKAAEEGISGAQGPGVGQDLVGNCRGRACFNLAEYYESYRKDKNQAIRWYRRAQELGHPRAAKQLSYYGL